jgi:uncharacterized protein YlzI (FlbEa/FlbD family)
MTFQEDLKFSTSKTVEGALDKIYRSYFKNIDTIEKIERVTNMNRQRAGVDTVLTLSSGEQIVVQEKWRRNRKFEGDFLIEYCSVWKKDDCQKYGWIYTIDSDYIFTVYEASKLVKIYPVVQLKLAWENNCVEWIKKYGKETYKNVGYITKFVVVPTDELEREIAKVMKFEYQQKLDI